MMSRACYDVQFLLPSTCSVVCTMLCTDEKYWLQSSCDCWRMRRMVAGSTERTISGTWRQVGQCQYTTSAPGSRQDSVSTPLRHLAVGRIVLVHHSGSWQQVGQCQYTTPAPTGVEGSLLFEHFSLLIKSAKHQEAVTSPFDGPAAELQLFQSSAGPQLKVHNRDM